MNSLTKRVMAALNMPSKIGDKIIRMQFILNKLTGNSNFPLPWPANIASPGQLGSDIQALVSAETQVKNRMPGASGLRNAALDTVLAHLRAVMGMVQTKADANPVQAEGIITGAGFDLRKKPGKHSSVNGAYNTSIGGTVLLTAEGGGHHEWQMSRDQRTLINLPATSQAHTMVSGLEPLEVWYFRSRKIGRHNEQYPWSSWVKLRIGEGGDADTPTPHTAPLSE